LRREGKRIVYLGGNAVPADGRLCYFATVESCYFKQAATLTAPL